MSDLARIATALDLSEDASADAALTALARQEPDPEKYVPISAVRDLMKDRAERIATMSRQEAEGRAQAALDARRISPGMVDWAVSLCRKNPDAFEDFLASSPAPYAHLFRSNDAHFRGKPGEGIHSDEERAISRNLGITPDQLKD